MISKRSREALKTWSMNLQWLNQILLRLILRGISSILSFSLYLSLCHLCPSEIRNLIPNLRIHLHRILNHQPNRPYQRCYMNFHVAALRPLDWYGSIGWLTELQCFVRLVASPLGHVPHDDFWEVGKRSDLPNLPPFRRFLFVFLGVFFWGGSGKWWWCCG